MQPVIATYTDFSAKSVHQIQPRFEALKTGKKKRKEGKIVIEDKPPRPKTGDIFSMKSVMILDTNLPEEPKKKTERPVKDKRKAELDNKTEHPSLDWDFKPWTKHREQWLFSKAKPEDHFTPKKQIKKVPVSLAAVLVKNAIFQCAEREKNQIQKDQINNSERPGSKRSGKEVNDQINNSERPWSKRSGKEVNDLEN
jgi:hypothetical protein